jgi:hypothetical protein
VILRRVTSINPNIVQDEKGDFFILFWLRGETISLNFSVYMGLDWYRGYGATTPCAPRPRANVHGVSDVRQTEIDLVQPLVPEPSAFVVKLAIEKVKSHK